jgi:hypothetical protein
MYGRLMNKSIARSRTRGSPKWREVLSFGLNISWLGFGTSDQLFVMRYPWGLMRYFLFGYLAQGFLPEEFSVKVKVLGGTLRPMVG